LPARDLRAAASAVKIAPIAGVSAMPVDDAVALAQESTKTARVEIVGLPARPTSPTGSACCAPVRRAARRR
jgi:hypothetical protein